MFLSACLKWYMYHLVLFCIEYFVSRFLASASCSRSPTYSRRKSPGEKHLSAKTPLPIRGDTLITSNPSWSRPHVMKNLALSFWLRPRVFDFPLSRQAFRISWLRENDIFFAVSKIKKECYNILWYISYGTIPMDRVLWESFLWSNVNTPLSKTVYASWIFRCIT